MGCSCEILKISPCRHKASLPCLLEGDIAERCTQCGAAGERNHVRYCDHPENETDRTTRGPNAGGVWSCATCPHKVTERVDADPPTRRVRVPGLPDHFNAGLLEHEGRLLLCSRKVSRLYLSSLDPVTYRPEWTDQIEIDLPGNQEDGRLHVHRGKLHAAFSSVTLVAGHRRIRQGYAELEWPHRAWEVKYGGPTEKNWGFFEHAGDLFAVYGIAPNHVVLRIEGSEVVEVVSTPNPFGWSAGHARGGAPPTFDGEAFTCFFHGHLIAGNRRVYSVGRYRFRAAPPFDVLEQTETPLLWANQHHPERPNEIVVFPCGAVRRPDRWLVSCGVADRRVEVMEWPA